MLGEGSYGKVAEAKCRVTGETVAIKYINDLGDVDYDWVKLIREIQIMYEFSQMDKNEHTVKILDLLMTSDDENERQGVFVVMEHMESDLKKLLNQSAEIDFTEDYVIILMYNLMRAMKFIHSANIMHRDLKPANILVDSVCNVKICDFGLARSLPESLVGKGSGNSKRTRDSIK